MSSGHDPRFDSRLGNPAWVDNWTVGTGLRMEFIDRSGQVWLCQEPVTREQVSPADEGLVGGGAATFAWRGIELTTSVMPYRFWLMQRLHDDLAAAPTEDADKVRSVFADAGLEALLDLRTLRRVERANHLEVWGPLVG